jgi:hypothetical protein
MRHTVVITMRVPAGGSGLRPVRVLLPRVDALIAEQPGKYALPENMPPKGLELRPLRRPRVPTLRSLVRLAARCDSAEQFGKALRRKWERQPRQQQRRQQQQTDD